MNVSNRKNFLWDAGTLCALWMVLLAGCGKEQAGAGQAQGGSGGGPKAPPVEVITVEREAVAWDQSYPGRSEGMKMVTIRPRVGGVIMKRNYVEGAEVEAGAVLFQIDPEPYKVSVKQAEAQLERAEAALRQAERDKKRADSLYGTDAMSERQWDNALSAYELARAERNLAEAALADAALKLDYTSVRSPVSGITSLEKVSEGSLVNAGDALTTVTQLEPMYVYFSLPEGDPAYGLVTQQQNGSDYQLKLRLRNNAEYAHAGTINFAETRIDESTGTVRVRAVFPNQERELLPGQFVRVRFEDMFLPKAAIIPPSAVLATPRGSMVYVIGEGNTVTPRPVVLGPVLEAGQLVMDGLKDGERVIRSSLIRIRPGMAVTPVEKAEQPKKDQE